MKLQTIAIACLSAGAMYANENTANRLKESAEVLTEVMATPDKGIPQELLEVHPRSSPFAACSAESRAYTCRILPRDRAALLQEFDAALNGRAAHTDAAAGDDTSNPQKANLARRSCISERIHLLPRLNLLGPAPRAGFHAGADSPHAEGRDRMFGLLPMKRDSNS